MNRLYLLLFILLIFSITDIFSQQKDFYPLDHFIPGDYQIIDTTSGNLNKDAFNDMALIIGHVADTTYDEYARTLLLLEGNGKGYYSIIVKSDKVVMCRVCGGTFGDPYESTVIKNGYFSIQHYGGSAWRWTRFITFKYEPTMNNFRLHKDGGTSFHTSDPNNAEEIFYNKELYGKLLFEDFDQGL